MALKIDTEYKGIPVAGAYVSLNLSCISADKTEVFVCALYRSAKGAEVFHAADFSAPYDLEGANPFVQAYEHLKTLPEFEGCTDC
jgi:hypothetical protein